MASKFREQRNRLLRLHSLVGVFIAFFLFVVCFSGTFSLFSHELARWVDGDVRIKLSENLPSLDERFTGFLKDAPEGAEFPLIVLNFPTENTPYYDMMALAAASGPPKQMKGRWSGSDASTLDMHGNTLPEWLAFFHTDLWLPYPFGRSIVGITGILLLLIVVTGFFMHRQPIKDSFKWRPNKNLMTLLLDSHSSLGLWGLLFHFVTAFTGAVLGLSSLVGAIFTVLAYSDGNHAELEPFPLPEFEAQGVVSPSITPDEVSHIVKEATGVTPAILIAINYGKDSGIYRVYHEVEKNMVRFGVIDIQASNGVILSQGEAPANFAARTYASVLPLHTASYGGIWLKVVYGVLATSLSLIIITGVMMWLERANALDGAKKDERLLNVMSKLSVGVCAGFPLAVVTTLYIEQFITVAPAERAFAIGTSVFSIWVSAMMFSFLMKKTAAALRGLLALTALILAGLPVLNYLVYGDGISALLSTGSHAVIIADVVFLLLAAGLALIVRTLKRESAK
ncbi:PepSY-associated TM helix domain-containing protein [Kordiimonas pumila]|uniref:PepSY-associated TM helix domain-containing protein n=1 Tax=Kordiimonas pumila TaxID=2161677 RepID=A0ABV7D6G8_9PROT|nr:PepSY-associated TM helix domain-containing protein [Kordiimonas pumila]